MWRACYAHNTTHRRFDDIAKLKRQQLLSGRLELAECVTGGNHRRHLNPRDYARCAETSVFAFLRGARKGLTLYEEHYGRSFLRTINDRRK